MKFAVQVGNPRFLTLCDDDCESLGDILQDLFPFSTEYCILWWNHISVPLSYKYDVSIVYDDIIYIVKRILSCNTGALDNEWPSNTFNAHWRISWDNNDMFVETEWKSVIGGAAIEASLNERSILEINKQAFLKEWKMLLLKIHEVISLCKPNSSELEGVIKRAMIDIEEIVSAIKGEGVLYEQT